MSARNTWVLCDTIAITALKRACLRVCVVFHHKRVCTQTSFPYVARRNVRCHLLVCVCVCKHWSEHDPRRISDRECLLISIQRHACVYAGPKLSTPERLLCSGEISRISQPEHVRMTPFALQCSTDVNKELGENMYSLCMCVFCKI